MNDIWTTKITNPEPLDPIHYFETEAEKLAYQKGLKDGYSNGYEDGKDDGYNPGEPR
jgi:hypothetical protein